MIVWVGNDPTVGSLGEELEVEKNVKRGKNGFGFGCKRMYEMRKATNLQTCMYLTGMWRCLMMKNQRCFGVEKIDGDGHARHWRVGMMLMRH